MGDDKQEFKWGRNILASFLASVTVKTTLAPVERIKIFMQTDINNRRFMATNQGREITSYRKNIIVSVSINLSSIITE